MRHRGLFIAGLVLLIVGGAGLLLAPQLLVSLNVLFNPQNYSSAGQRLYYTGIGDDGRPISRTGVTDRTTGFGMLAGASCVDCHQEDGKGGRVRMMMWTFDVPDIRYSWLTSPHTEDGERIAPWTDADIGHAIEFGIEPGGERLKAPMPQWRMTDTEIQEIIGYLKELSTQ